MQVDPKNLPGVGHYLQGVQHFGITVDDLDKSIEFYTEVLGGKVAISGDSFSGEVLLNTLFQKELIEASMLGINPRRLGVPDILTGKNDVLDVRFISFGNTVLELLHFREGRLKPNAPNIIEKLPGVVGYANAPHISFHVKDDVSLNDFAVILEQECDRRGIEVLCNRVITVNSQEERKLCEARYAANKFWHDPDNYVEGYSELDFGDFHGWSLFYCKGPNGEQLEFNQVTRTAKENFQRAQNEYNKANGTEYRWPTRTLNDFLSSQGS
jgi:catechol 2,3-dioxygenase-like lactoylglutathione lyase family enzyme